MQINRTGYWLLALFLGGGIAFVLVDRLVMQDVTFLMIGVIWIAVSLGLIAYLVRAAARARHEQWLFKTGIRGKGTVVAASAGAYVNEQPLVSLVLDVDVPGQGQRRVTRKLLVSNFAAHRLTKGMMLPVYANPSDPEDLLVVW